MEAPELAVPGDLQAALASDAAAAARWERMPPSHRREYVEWVTSAKRAETRARRVAKALGMLAAEAAGAAGRGGPPAG